MLDVMYPRGGDPTLDGAPEDFPYRKEAMAEYRALWSGFLMGKSSDKFLGGRGPTPEAQKRMDELQAQISPGPGPVWRAFAASMPGFREWWEGAIGKAHDRITGPDGLVKVKLL